MKNKQKKLSVVIPAYNEERNIEKIIELAVSSIEDFDSEIVIVDDGSTDGTVKIVKKMMRKNPKIKIIQHQINRGYADALKTGFKKSSGEYIVMIDADLQNSPSDIPKLVKWSQKGYDMVIGWRKNRRDSLTRLMISRGWNSLTHLLFSLPFPDINGKPKIFRKNVLENIEIETKQWVIDLELAHKYLKAGHKVIQIPVKHSSREDKGSKATMQKGMISLFNLLAYRIKSF